MNTNDEASSSLRIYKCFKRVNSSLKFIIKSKSIQIMKNLLYLILAGIFVFTLYSFTHIPIENENRNLIIDELVVEESKYARANCYCRIGDDRGPSQNEYPNALKDLGKLKEYKGIKPVNNKNEKDCGRRCAIAAEQWLSKLSTDQLCAMRKKSGSTRLLAYSKVGGRKWQVRGAGRQINCCNTGGTLTCPSGWNSENNNYPGYCSKAMCPPLVPGDRRLYNKDGSAWGFIYKNMTYQLRKGNTTSSSWQSCNR